MNNCLQFHMSYHVIYPEKAVGRRPSLSAQISRDIVNQYRTPHHRLICVNKYRNRLRYKVFIKLAWPIMTSKSHLIRALAGVPIVLSRTRSTDLYPPALVWIFEILRPISCVRNSYFRQNAGSRILS